MYSVEIHTPITMNEHFSVMCYLFVKSLALHAGFDGEWRVVFTVSGDSDLTAESPEFTWAREYPVTFQDVDPDLWKSMGYVGTGLQCLTTEHVADVVLYMDADMLVIGSLREVVHRIAKAPGVYGWPAWFSGDMSFDRLFAAAGIPNAERYRIVLRDDGADTEDPWWPRYFNFGFIGVSREIANDMGRTFPDDQAFVMEHFENYFAGQVALALNIVRNDYPWGILDERYNVGSDHPTALAHYEKKLGRPMFPSQVANEDPRVMHYCFPTPTLEKKRDFRSWPALRRFVERPGLAGSEKVIQNALRSMNLFDPTDRYQQIHASLALPGVERRLREAKRDLESAIAESNRLVTSLSRQLDQVRARNQGLRDEVRRHRMQVSNMRSDYERSFSWRLTTPLRWLAALWK